MPKITPLETPAHSVPSRSKNFTPRAQPMISSTGNAPEERASACNIGGTSGNTSFTAIWLKPQLRQSISIKATAPGLRGRPAEGVAGVEDIDPRWPACRRVLGYRHDPEKARPPLDAGWTSGILIKIMPLTFDNARRCRRFPPPTSLAQILTRAP